MRSLACHHNDYLISRSKSNAVYVYFLRPLVTVLHERVPTTIPGPPVRVNTYSELEQALVDIDPSFEIVFFVLNALVVPDLREVRER